MPDLPTIFMLEVSRSAIVTDLPGAVYRTCHETPVIELEALRMSLVLNL